ncbi:MFS transporter permease [Corynebacterium sp. HMSC058E07]|uniref:MFS transporter n=1 Tax=Corynebacterium sp. HMSC058E07 TaxID=1715157 RepID=UPI0008A4FA85|nr:MFS transporter [Corynebacterium sp. HMSC058E07]OFM59534.1 MFS transporter permease [Corynebacterium sp. HMSC058E07]
MLHTLTAAEREPKLFFWKFGIAFFGSVIAWAGPTQLLLGLQMIELRPDSKEESLALLMMLGGATAVVSSLITGYAADRSWFWVNRWGKRLPWALLAAPLVTVGLFLMSFTPSFWVLTGLWCLVQVFVAFVTNNLMTVTADVVPQEKFGLVSGIVGATYTFGIVGGTAVATALPITQAYWAVGVISLVFIFQFAVGRGHVDSHVRPHNSLSVTVGDEGSYRNYWLVFASRFVIHLANYTSLFYLLYYLRDHIGVPDPDAGVLMLTVLYAVFTIITAIVSGNVSDRIGRRKILVVVSAFGVAAATGMMTIATGMELVCAAAILLGISWGVFSSVDQAMVNESLPSKKNRARDVSLMSLTQGVSNMFCGGLAALALRHFDYPGMFLMCSIICIVGALMVLPVTSSK